MADRQQHAHGEGRTAAQRHGYAPAAADSSTTTLLRRVQTHAPNSTQVVGFLTLAVSGAVLLLLTGLTLTGAVVALIFLGPIALLTSPIWVPVAIALFVLAAVALSACAFVVVAVAGGTWMYRYFTGRHPVGADRVDYARSRIADTASHVKDYAREYGGYLHSRAKDAAPGA
uniref:Oleosin n=1 Tax=Oryza punctata TaxID=4537 RepID=A0A0E0L629_ORYPU